MKTFLLGCITVLLGIQTIPSAAQPIESIRYVRSVTPLRGGSTEITETGQNPWVGHFFGSRPGRVGFLYEPSFDAKIGMRITEGTEDSTDTLEAMHVTNYWEVEDSLSKAYPLIGLSIDRISNLSQQESDSILQYNRTQTRRHFAAQYAAYRIETVRKPIPRELAERVHAETLRLLRAAQDTLSMPGLIFDGNTMTFRCTADDTLWSLRYHVPEGAFKQLSDLFLQMAADVREGCFDPNAYLRQLPLVPTEKPNK